MYIYINYYIDWITRKITYRNWKKNTYSAPFSGWGIVLGTDADIILAVLFLHCLTLR